MTTRTLLVGIVIAATASVPSLGLAQAHLPNLKRQLTPHNNRLPRPSHDLYKIHGRRLAVSQSDGRHQPRVLSKRNRHSVRQDVRSVAHHVTAPHKP